MARKLFERQAIRRRTGALAAGVQMVVYTDAAGTVLADISTSSGGSSIAGSVVTTANIAGFGPAALRFYGPPDGTDTLYIRVPSDTSLGVQEIEASTDDRLDALEAGAAGIPATVFDAKGDIIAATAADTAARLAAGANDTVLTADSTTGTGLKWATPAAAAHPNLATHDSLGLATDAELTTHAADTSSVHGITDTTQVALLNADNIWDGDQIFGNGPIIDARAFVQGGDAGDFALAVQRAIDYAETLVTATGRPPAVRAFPPGLYRWRTPIVWKNAPLIGDDLAQCAAYWDGSAGATVITRNAASGNSYFLMEHFYFRKGTAEPATWIDLTGAGAVDKFGRLRNFGLGDCTSDAIKLDGWINLHWTDFRMDHTGGYAIRATPHSSQSFSSFCLERFTFDHSRTSGNGTGFLMIDDTNAAPAPGVVRLAGARIELNTAWSGNKAIVVDKAGPTNGTVFHLEDIALFVGAGTANVLYREGAGSPNLSLDNVQLNGTITLVAGDVPANYPTPPVRSYHAKTTVSANYAAVWAAGTNGVGPEIYMAGWGSLYPQRVFLTTDANARYRMNETGQMEWGPGSAAPDTTLRRSAADTLRTDDLFVAALGLQALPMTAPSAPASGATVYVDTADSKLKAIKASGDIIVFG